ncbi:hypothetical protein HF1_05750 [Mycoplasma haemofelis str. Langford 1]|uniref:Uncharacterized protein n=1 Tax=Mycoplasma haemofelis (strain Langford 1) TaxID=941640 RepID=E8ZHG2_MYCHL|nr:hypothetical protein [Mycoplasma haemofelis]CBY92583.1 hypothetical protein HF1_05750 [Mycoplasma haemofelis str. Langford 1]
MFGLGKLKFLLHKKALASILVASGSAAGAYFWWNQEESMSVSERVASTKAKIMKGRPNYFKLFQTIAGYWAKGSWQYTGGS